MKRNHNALIFARCPSFATKMVPPRLWAFKTGGCFAPRPVNGLVKPFYPLFLASEGHCGLFWQWGFGCFWGCSTRLTCTWGKSSLQHSGVAICAHSVCILVSVLVLLSYSLIPEHWVGIVDLLYYGFLGYGVMHSMNFIVLVLFPLNGGCFLHPATQPPF